ncbi:MAG: phosphocholine cytidylyltransferase family protein [Euryarchaeota archaeon]|nr:phosphocholine cytidylyltransferase family protein [Euryarchaeota archaeon]
MKAVILAAGLGSRLGELTRDRPKTLLEVCGRPLISYILENLSSCGIEEAVIVTGYAERRLREVVGDGSASGVRVSYVRNPRYATTNNSYSLSLVRERVRGGFLIVNSDVLFHPGILEILLSSPLGGVVLSVDLGKELGEEEMKVTARGGRITDIGKELPPREAVGEYIGLARVDAASVEAFFAALDEVLRELGSGVFYEEAFRGMIGMGLAVRYTSTDGLPWVEIDTPEDLWFAEAEVAPALGSSCSSSSP